MSMLEEILRLNKKPDDSNIKSEDAKKEEAMEIKARGNRAYKVRSS